MYSRSIERLRAIAQYSTCISGLKSLFNKELKSFKNHVINCNKSFINIRTCTTLESPPNKDKIAAEQFASYMKDPEKGKRYKMLQLEIDVMRQNGELLPKELKYQHWVELIDQPSQTRRKKFLKFLFGLEMKDVHGLERKQREKEFRLKAFEEWKEVNKDVPDDVQYKLGKNSLFFRIYDSTIDNQSNWKLIQAMMFGSKLVLDCGYEDMMSTSETRMCARQLQMSFAANRNHRDPFDLYFMNLNKSGLLYQELYSFIPTMQEPDFPINLMEKSYLDVFDRKKLVYLTPDAHMEVNKIDPDDIYIVGALVDKSSCRPSSLAKAKREGIRMAKLPIDKYLHFGSTSSGKRLTINQMVEIMADAASTGDWEKALQHVPRRKLFEYGEYKMRKKIEYYLKKKEKLLVSESIDYK